MNVGRLSLENLETFGEYTSLHYQGQSYTNKERAEHAAAFASVLREHGVASDQRVVVMMPNSPDVTSAFQAVWKLGGVIIPVTPQLGAREVRYMLEDSEAPYVVTSPILAPLLQQATQGLSSVKEVMVIGQAAEGQDVPGTRIDDEIKSAHHNLPIETLEDRGEDDLALLLYTSGTTGNPKGVMLTHENMLSNAKSVASMNDTIEPHERSLHVLPLSHSFGVLMMNLGYLFGSVDALLPRFDLQEVFENLHRYKIQRMSVVPTMLTYMLKFPAKDKFDLSELKEIASGGAALPNDVRLEFEKTFDCQVREGYGMSECAPSATGYKEEDEYRPGSVGRAIPGVDISIRGDDELELPAGEWGEICIRGPNVMKGYLNKPEATSEALRGGWLHSGDIGYMDEDGFVFITDRKKDLVIKGGENISPREIEEAIHGHPAVAECAVIGVPHETFGEDLVAVVSLKPGQDATDEEIKAQAASAVTKFKVPSAVHFVDDLPKSPIGKILKRDLRERFS